MKLCRFIIRPLSPWSGPLRSDTLYGLICWHVAENEGQAACRELIEAFCANRPPFQLSSAMPAGCLPMPCLPAPGRGEFRALAAETGEKGEKDTALFNMLRRFKKFRKNPWLSLNAWQRHRHNLSMRALFMDRDRQGEEREENTRQTMGIEPHAAIDRQSGTAAQGRLFFMARSYFDQEARLHLYARAADPRYLLKYLKLIGELGFGRDAGTGNGQFAIEPDADFNAASLDTAEANARLLLSVCASPDMRDTAGFYRVEVKRGKTGPGHANPFKKPFLILREGSLLSSALTGPFVLHGLNADSRVVQILQPLSLPCRLQKDEP